MKILVTGIIASGKTVFSNILSQISGFPVFYADKVSRDIRNKIEVKKRLYSEFGIDEKRSLDDQLREKLIDDRFRNTLNSIMHPLIKTEIESITNIHYDCIVDSPIPLQMKITGFFDRIILITCPDKIIIKRLQNKRFDPMIAMEIYRVQKDEFDHLKYDFTFQNDGKTDLEKIANSFLNSIKNTDKR